MPLRLSARHAEFRLVAFNGGWTNRGRGAPEGLTQVPPGCVSRDPRPQVPHPAPLSTTPREERLAWTGQVEYSGATSSGQVIFTNDDFYHTVNKIVDKVTRRHSIMPLVGFARRRDLA